MTKLQRVFPLLLFAGLLSAQQQQPATAQQPDCVKFFTLGNTGSLGVNSANQDNRQVGCYFWTVEYTANGLTGLSLTFQDAPDSSGTPGTFITFAGTTVIGSNPSTATTSAIATFTGYYPWLRTHLSGLTGSGSVSGVFYGWRVQPTSSSSAVIVGNVAVVGPDANGTPSTTAPVQVAGNDGTDVERIKTDTSGNLLTAGVTQAGVAMYGCDNQVAFSAVASGNTQIIAASGSTVIRICHISFATDTVQTIQLTKGTGAACVSSNRVLAGSYYNVTTFAVTFGSDSPLIGRAGDAICINQSAVGNVGGVVIYSQY